MIRASSPSITKVSFTIFLHLCSLCFQFMPNKSEQYKALLPKITSLIDKKADLIANLANISAFLKDEMGYLEELL